MKTQLTKRKQVSHRVPCSSINLDWGYRVGAEFSCRLRDTSRFALEVSTLRFLHVGTTLNFCDELRDLTSKGIPKKKNETMNWVPTIVWLVVSTHLKNISQNGNLPQVGLKIKNPWNHHLVVFLLDSRASFGIFKLLHVGKVEAPGGWSNPLLLQRFGASGWFGNFQHLIFEVTSHGG